MTALEELGGMLRTGRFDSAAQLLRSASHVDLDGLLDNGVTLLHEAVARHDLASVSFLLARHAEPDVPAGCPYPPRTGETAGSSALITCVLAAAPVEIAEALIAAGADLDHTDWRGRTALFYAARGGLGPLHRLLEQAGAGDLEPEDAMLLAARRGDAQALRAALDLEPQAALLRPSSPSALCAAAGAGHGECVRLLLDAGLDVSGRVDGRSPLELAILGSHAEVVSMLLGAGVDPFDGGVERAQWLLNEARRAGNPGMDRAFRELDAAIRPLPLGVLVGLKGASSCSGRRPPPWRLLWGSDSGTRTASD